MQSIVCIHASASSGRQWRALADRLAGRYRVLTPDLYSSGGSPQWPDDRPLAVADEVALLEPAFAAAAEPDGAPFHLVGHSYGGVVALHAALADPARVRSLVLFEPVLFGLLLANLDAAAAREILAVRDDTAAAVERGAPDAAGERFLDYWMGPGTWARLPDARRESSARAMPGVRSQFTAIFGEPRPVADYAALAVPTLLLTGTASPVASREVARMLAKTLPNLTTVELDGVGHMAPVTHPDVVNDAIEAYLTSS
jgi:pimeloyl-ACP methyl ester carboxylesterase